MNLERAKAILIIAFAGLNLFLGYQLFWPDFGRLTRVAITADQMRLTESMLNENNYFLEPSLDRAVQTSDFITVAPDLNYQKKIISSLIEKGASLSEADNSVTFRSEGEIVTIHTSGLVRLIYSPGHHLADNTAGLEQRELRVLAEQFLSDRNCLPEGIMFDYMEKSDDGLIVLYYYQVIDTVPIYASQLKVIIESDKVYRVEAYWLELVDRIPARDMEVISATEALTNLVKELGPSPDPINIIKIELGYFSGEYDAEKWEIPPVWRIVLEGQQCYYINAFTGNLEKDTVIPEQTSNSSIST
jgi:regulatory protein YycI of two-component signal transduction system YycFG